ncbi:MAG TPA: hypothetical protein VKV19_13015 [Ktedonobacteraceae bacterium]|nr:hypothetical protein [Ktedonobacteraceae bacterium]
MLYSLNETGFAELLLVFTSRVASKQEHRVPEGLAILEGDTIAYGSGNNEKEVCQAARVFYSHNEGVISTCVSGSDARNPFTVIEGLL